MGLQRGKLQTVEVKQRPQRKQGKGSDQGLELTVTILQWINVTIPQWIKVTIPQWINVTMQWLNVGTRFGEAWHERSKGPLVFEAAPYTPTEHLLC